jgi:hypothetical protein
VLKPLLLATSLIVAIATGCSGAGTATHKGLVSVMLNSTSIDSQGPTKACVGSGGYHDIAPGANVTIYDGNGKILVTGAIDNGIGLGDSNCIFTSAPLQIPDSKFYEVEVSNRGKVNYSQAQLAKSKYIVSLTLGNGT